MPCQGPSLHFIMTISILGTPVYTVYAGKIGSVDRFLIDEGKVKLIHSLTDIENITLEKKSRKEVQIDRHVFEFVVDNLLDNRENR